MERAPFVSLHSTGQKSLYREELIMAADPKDPKTTPETKKVETMLLSAEELRRLSGGATNPKPPPVTLPGGGGG